MGDPPVPERAPSRFGELHGDWRVDSYTGFLWCGQGLHLLTPENRSPTGRCRACSTRRQQDRRAATRRAPTTTGDAMPTTAVGREEVLQAELIGWVHDRACLPGQHDPLCTTTRRLVGDRTFLHAYYRRLADQVAVCKMLIASNPHAQPTPELDAGIARLVSELFNFVNRKEARDAERESEQEGS